MRFNYILPGILDPLENPRTWDYQAQAWLYEHDCGLAAGFNYSAGVIGGLTSRDKFSAMIASDLLGAMNAGFSPIVTAGHSNGCPLLIEAHVNAPTLFTDTMNLIAAATDVDCDKNGLNLIASRGQVKKVRLFVSPDDEILGLPGISYGRLGKDGPQNASAALTAILEIVSGTYSHCGWIREGFESVMQKIADGGT